MIVNSVASEAMFEIDAMACVPDNDKLVVGAVLGPVPEIVISGVLIDVGELPAALLAVALAVHLSPPRKPVLVTDLCVPGTVAEYAPLKEQLKSILTFSVLAATPVQLAVAAPVLADNVSPLGESVGAGYAGREVSTTISKKGLTLESDA